MIYICLFPIPSMDPSVAWSALAGKTVAEKLQGLGVGSGKMVDIRRLSEISRSYGVAVWLFFEEDLARDRPLESVFEEFNCFPPFERPYISVADFIRFTRENDPSFEQTMREFPLMIEIVSSGETTSDKGESIVPYITGLMPFLDELDVDAPPAP
jgi:hypothetical protein